MPEVTTANSPSGFDNGPHGPGRSHSLACERKASRGKMVSCLLTLHPRTDHCCRVLGHETRPGCLPSKGGTGARSPDSHAFWLRAEATKYTSVELPTPYPSRLPDRASSECGHPIHWEPAP